jgi:hypothetical protein
MINHQAKKWKTVEAVLSCLISTELLIIFQKQNLMNVQLLYDEEGDVLDVFFTDEEHVVAYAGYEARQGIVVYVTKSFSPVQLTVVSFRRLTQAPVVHFNELKKQPAKIRNKLMRLIASPPLSSFLRIDANTFYGRVMNPAILDICAESNRLD